MLIAEAEKAAEALEVAATKSPIAQASLLETRKLITEAIQSLESIDTVHITSTKNDLDPSLGPAERISQVEMAMDMGNGNSNQAELKEVNGTKILASSKDEDLNFTNLHDILNGENEILSANSNGYSLPSIRLESLLEHPSSPNHFGQLEANGNVKPQRNPLLNGSQVQQVKEESPSKPISSTKKWVRGRLVEVQDGDKC